MVSYHNGDLLESGCDMICHQVNLQGVMGGGLALQIATKFPRCEEVYKYHLKAKDNTEGDFCIYWFRNNKKRHGCIANCFTQELNFNTNYDWLKSCFGRIKRFCEERNIKTIGVPFNYGCGIANGDWNIVEKIFKYLFENEKNIDFQIWKYNKEV